MEDEDKLFNLQIDVLLPNVRPKESIVKSLENFVSQLRAFLVVLPSIAPTHPLEASDALLKQGIAVPFSAPLPTIETAWKVAFERPSDVFVVGSWADKIGVKSLGSVSWTIDIALEMPAHLFQEKDYLDARFFHKRAYYLAFVASKISTSKELNVACEYESLHSDNRLTSLILTPKKDNPTSDFTSLNARIRLLPILPEPCPIALSHLSPQHCNIRVQSSDNERTTTAASINISISTSASRGVQAGANSPVYNTDLLTCVFPRARLLHTRDILAEAPAFRDALALLRVWVNQRGYGSRCSNSGNDRGDSDGVAHVKATQSGGCIAGFEGRGFFWAALVRALIVGEEKSEGRRKEKGFQPFVRKAIGHGLNSYQLFRAVLNFLARHDFSKETFAVKGGSQYPAEAYEPQRGPILLDSTSTNLLAGVPITSLDLLRYDAQLTLDMLNKTAKSSTLDAFAETFLQDKRVLFNRFDIVLGVDLKGAQQPKSSLVEILDFGNPQQYLLYILSQILKRALGDRVRAIGLIVPPIGARPISSVSATAPLARIHIGLILNAENAFRLVDHGPPGAGPGQESREAEEFRAFWGPKAELRRFKDGRILESVVWEAKASDERARIPCEIVRYVLQHHLKLDSTTAVHAVQQEFDGLLKYPEAFSARIAALEMVQPPGFKSAMDAFDRLVRDLKGLDEEVPLAILMVSAVSSRLRYTSVFAPTRIPPAKLRAFPATMRYVPCMEVVIQFERSARWPDGLAAIWEMKLALFERIARALMAKVNGLRASVVLGDATANVTALACGPGSGACSALALGLDRAYLEILTPDGWAFSVRMRHDREAMHLEQLLQMTSRPSTGLADGASSSSMAAYASTPVVPAKRTLAGRDGDGDEEHKEKPPSRRAALDAYVFYTRSFIHAPKHHRAIANLSHRFAAYAGTVRLVKRWMASHWVYEGHVRGEAVELLCAYVFIRGAAGKASALLWQGDDSAAADEKSSMGTPATKELGFFRTLSFLKNWAWEDGLFVPVYESGAQGKEDGEKSAALRIKAGSGSGVWTIWTAEDPEGKMWTMEMPNALIARRIKALATSCVEYVSRHERDGFITKTLFLHPTDDYDILIRLKQDVLCRMHQRLHDANSVKGGVDGKKTYANLPSALFKDDDALRVDFDPALMLYRDLKRVFAGTLELFYDAFGGNTIGAVWDPSTTAARSFRVMLDYSSIPVAVEKSKKPKKQVILNKSAVLADIQRLGDGLIERIEVQHS